MAKKRKIQKVEIVAPTGIEGKSSLYLDLESDEMDILKQKKVGDEIVLVVRGTLASVSQRKHGDDKKVTGSLSLEDYDLEIGDNSMWDDLADDKDDE